MLDLDMTGWVDFAFVHALKIHLDFIPEHEVYLGLVFFF